MLVIAVENAPPRLRGRLSLWLREVRAGLYVGTYGRRIRERIWNETLSLTEGSDPPASAVIIWSAPTESGFRFEATGPNRRRTVYLDDLPLVAFDPPEET
jgi:CRISPR-associated protein Cas2